MTPMKRRMSRAARLDSGRTIAATVSARASVASAMDGAPGVDPDPIRRQEDRQHALLADSTATDQVDGKVGAEEHAVARVADQVGAEERAQERERVDAQSEGVGLGRSALVDHDVLGPDRQRHLGAGGEAVDLAVERGAPESHRAVAHDRPGQEIHHADEVGYERRGRLAIDLERRPDLLDRARSEEHTSELQSRGHLVCRLLLEKKNIKTTSY